MTAHPRTRLARLSPAGIAALGAPASSIPSKGAPKVITTGQVYVACNPLDVDVEGNPRRIRIVDTPPGGRVVVETLDSDGCGTRRRSMYFDKLFDSAATKAGKPRVTGYALESEAAR